MSAPCGVLLVVMSALRGAAVQCFVVARAARISAAR
jgi:hypothetical protein